MSETENVYKALMRARALGALETARKAESITHSGVKGRVREIIISDLLRPLLPADVSIASGQITECKTGRLSKQQDVILFDASILPPISFDASAAIIPAEAVLYTIEVKSTLTRATLQQAHDSAGDLAQFEYLNGIEIRDGIEYLQPVPKLNSVVFALSSDLSETEFGEIQRYRQIYGSGHPHLKCICVAGLGYWYEANGSWIRVSGTFPGDEVLAFLGGVMNTYKKISARRGIQSIGNYIIVPGPGLKTVPSGTRPTIRVKCEQCSQEAVVSMSPDEPRTKYWPNGFVGPNPCDRCGNRFVASAGTYQLVDGLFVLDENGPNL